MTAERPLEAAREAVCEYGLQLVEQDLTTGTGGNVSVREPNGLVAISPSGIPYDSVEAADVPVLKTDGTPVFEPNAPSSETPMHLTIYRERPDVGGIVHTHSPYATTFASLDEPIPASHYLVAFAGSHVPVTEYETYGTEALGREAAQTLGDAFDACLLQNHGTIAVGETIESAFETALMVEFVARIEYQARAIGEPNILPDDEIRRVRDRFKDYGQYNNG